MSLCAPPPDLVVPSVPPDETSTEAAFRKKGLSSYTAQYELLCRPSDIDLQLANDELHHALIMYDATASEEGRNCWVACPSGGKCTLSTGCTTHHWSAVHSARHPMTWTVTRHYHYAVHILRLRGVSLKQYMERSLNRTQRIQFVSMGTYMVLACERGGPIKRMQHMAVASSLQASGLGPLLPSAKRPKINS